MSQVYGFSIELEGLGSQLFGFSIEVDHSLIVTVIDGSGVPIPNADVEIYQNGTLINSIQANASGVALISLVDAGSYEISTPTSDRKQTITWDGVNAVIADFVVYGIQHQYRIKAKGAGAVGDSDWSEILTVNI